MNYTNGRSPSGSASWVSVFRRGCGLIVLVLAGCFNIDPDPVPMTYGTIMDARDSQVYRALTVQGMTWLQQDLNFQAPGSICPDTMSVCDMRLYSWSTAMGVDSQFDTTLLGASSGFRQGVCPAGWHLPTLAEWNTLDHVMSSPGITGEWASQDGKGFDLNGWDHSGNASLGWYWIADETGSGTARIANFQVSASMDGPQGILWIEQVIPEPKKGKLGIRCLLDGAK
jgi:uncharacterized protein (TIGR02145 family)